jgi:hypothetical protein
LQRGNIPFHNANADENFRTLEQQMQINNIHVIDIQREKTIFQQIASSNKTAFDEIISLKVHIERN